MRYIFYTIKYFFDKAIIIYIKCTIILMKCIGT